MIQFPVWISPFSIFKIGFKLVGKSFKHFVKEVFFIGGEKVGEIIPLSD